MIIAGYPGIGKTSLAAKNLEVIDLESSHFHGGVDVRRSPHDEWFKTYVDSFEDENSKYFAAYIRARECYDGDIDRMKNCGLRRIEIQDMDYNLTDLVFEVENTEE